MDTILFRHKVTYENAVGELVVTPTMLSFVPTDMRNAQSHTSVLQIAWSNVKITKYSPADDPKNRVMMRVEMITNVPAVVLHFQGADLDKKRAELERLKSIISDVRKKESAQTLDTTTSSSGVASGTGDGNGHSAGGNGHSSLNSTTSMLSVDAKAKLLAADKSLAKLYRELVEQDRILDENEFWSAHASNLPMLLSGLSSSSMDRGKGTSIIGDVMDSIVVKNGRRSVNLTPQQKEHIFAMYPAVRLAFEHEVGVEKSEPEFWMAFFQSEFYLRTFSAAGAKNAMGQTDDMFSRYNMLVSAEEQKKQAQKATAGAGIVVRAEKLTVDQSVDLTATYEDFHGQENNYLGDLSTPAAGGGGGLKTTAAGTGSIYKYNRHSMVVMDDSRTKRGRVDTLVTNRPSIDNTAGTNETMGGFVNEEVVELQREEGGLTNEYIPLELTGEPSSSLASSSSSLMNVVGASGSDDVDTKPTIVTPFGVSTSAVRKTAVSMIAGVKRKRVSSSELLGSIESIVPSNEVALEYIRSDVKSIEMSQLSVSGTAHLLTARFQEVCTNLTQILCVLCVCVCVCVHYGCVACTGNVGVIQISWRHIAVSVRHYEPRRR
jgi:hypothetical protein